MAPVDAIELETKVKNRYRHVAEQPHGAYHFETGRALAERLGYPADLSRQDSGRGDRVLRRVGYFVDGHVPLVA
jgi:arsenite methyltransferase